MRLQSMPGIPENLYEPVHHFAEVDSEGRGAVFARPEVVEFILDLTGYTVDRPLHRFRLLEPSFGEGDFLIPVVERLVESYRAHGEGNQVH